MPRGSIELRISIEGRQRLLDALSEFSDDAKMSETFNAALPGVLEDFTERAKDVTHRITGHLAEAHTWDYDVRHARGRVFIDPRVSYLLTPRDTTLRQPAVYGQFEHARGGTHAFYQVVIDRYGDAYMDMGMRAMTRHWDKSTMYHYYPVEEFFFLAGGG